MMAVPGKWPAPAPYLRALDSCEAHRTRTDLCGYSGIHPRSVRCITQFSSNKQSARAIAITESREQSISRVKDVRDDRRQERAERLLERPRVEAPVRGVLVVVELRQQDRLERMIFPIRQQIAYISTFTSLQPGDIIVTGTPTGAGARFDPPRFLVPGDIIEVDVPGIGVLRSFVEDEA